MSKKKIMTISDLYNFCMKNNFCHFSSATNNEEICVQMPAIFEKEEKVDKDKEGLTPFVAKAYHDHINLNKSEIKPEVLETTLPSAMLRPILASIVVDEETGEKDFGSHDFVFEEDEDGNERIRYIEQPVGVIFGDNTIEYDEEDDVNRAILHGYLYDGYCQDAVDIMNRRKTVDCSVELSIREMSFNTTDKVLTLDDFYVSGLTLLNAKVNPGMKGSQVTIADFSKENNSMFSQNEELLNEIKKLNENLSHFNINTSLKEGGNAVTKFEELLNQYGKTVEDITFEYENLTDEELEAKFAEVFGEDDTDGEGADPEPTSEGDEGTDDLGEDGDASEPEGDEGNSEPEEGTGAEQFEQKENLVRTYEISHDDIRWGLYNLLSAYEDADNEWYYICAVYDTYFVYENWSGDKIYGQSYTKDGEKVAFDGDRYNLHRELLTDSEYAELNSMRANYAAIETQLKEYQLKEETAQKDALFVSEDYSSISDKEEFKALAENHAEFSVDELKSKLDAIILDYAKKGSLNFSAEPEKKTVGMTKLPIQTNSNKKSRYGSLFSK